MVSTIAPPASGEWEGRGGEGRLTTCFCIWSGGGEGDGSLLLAPIWAGGEVCAADGCCGATIASGLPNIVNVVAVYLQVCLCRHVIHAVVHRGDGVAQRAVPSEEGVTAAAVRSNCHVHIAHHRHDALPVHAVPGVCGNIVSP